MRIDLLPAASRPEPRLKFTRILLLLAMTFLLLGGLYFAGMQYLSYQSASMKLEQMTNLYQSLQPELQLALRHEAEKGALNQRQMEVLQLFDLYQNETLILKNLAVSLPTTDIWLGRITTLPRGEVILEGGSNSFAMVGSFLKNVNLRNFFQASSIKEIRQFGQKDAFSYYTFTIEMNTGRSSLEYAEK
jgi:Tfp pilus assembly protein PilN